MKRIHILFLHLLVAASLMVGTGCYKDKGNYTFTEINKVSITDPLSSTALSLKLSDTLRLDPTVAQTKETTTDSLAYRWRMYEVRADGGPSPYIDLASTK